MAGRTLLPHTWDVPEAIRNRFGERAGRQRLMLHEQHAVLILHQPPKADERTRNAVIYWRNPAGEWRATAGGKGLPALQELVQTYTKTIGALDERLTKATTAEEYYRVFTEVVPLCRAAHHLHHVLQQLREAFPDDSRLITLRDDAYDAEREADLLLEEARHAMDYAIARRSEDEARHSLSLATASHRLNVLAALFLPITALASIFGMSLNSGLEGRYEVVAFWAIVAAGFVLGVITTMAVLVRHRHQ
jgi:hypothetical protein